MTEISDKSIRENILVTDGNIVVSANAGTGKTYMTVERIKRDLSLTDNYQTYAAITFTNKAAKELEERLAGNISGFIGTNDKFVINEIIVPFATDIYPQMKGITINSDYTDTAKCDEGKDLLHKFVSTGIIGTYRDSHKNFAFKLALHILKKSHVAARYMQSRYYRIYIDEYQDSDKDMHKLFCYLESDLNIRLFVVGDIKQSIYEWRGGYPEGFTSFISSEKFTAFNLLHNFRSNIQIQNYATLFIDEIKNNYLSSNISNEVEGVIYSNPIDVTSYIGNWLSKGEKCSLLVFQNADAEKWAKRLEKFGFVYIPRAPLDEPNLENNQIWISRGIACYFLKKRYNEYSFFDEIPNQEQYDIISVQKKLLKIKNEYLSKGWTASIELQIKEIYLILFPEYDVDKFEIEINALKKTLEDEQYVKSYNIESYDRISTTIHSSKGLQYSQVIVCAENYVYRGAINDQVHYVAITRPENQLLVLFDDNVFNSKVYKKILDSRVVKMNETYQNVDISDFIRMERI